MDAARILLHRATIVVRSAGLLDEQGAAVPVAAGTAPSAHTKRVTKHRTTHRAIVTRHLAALRGRFLDLAGCDPPDEFSDRGGKPPDGPGDTTDPAATPNLLSDVRRTEWAAYGLETILTRYESQAQDTADLVRQARDALRRWAELARVDA